MRIETQAARNTDPETSHMAAEAITKSGARMIDVTKVYEFVFRAALNLRKPLTAGEIARGLDKQYPLEDWTREKALKRLADLKGFKVKHGERRKCTALKHEPMCVTWELIGGSGD